MNWQTKLLRFIRPVVKWAVKIRWPYSKKRMHPYMYEIWAEKILPGDIILSNTYGSFGNILNPAEWQHCALYVGGDRIIEAVTKGVVKNSLPHHIYSKDEI